MSTSTTRMPLPEDHRQNRYVIAIHAVALAAVCVTALVTDGFFRTNDDACQYYQVGINLAHGQGFTFNGSAYQKYPPVYALFVAAVRLCGGDCRSLQVANCLMALAAYWLGWRLMRQQGMGVFAAAAMSLAATCMVLTMAEMVLTETLYTLLSLGALVLLDRTLRGDHPSARHKWICYLAGAVFAILTVQTRSVGVALGLAFFGAAILQKRPRSEIIAGVVTSVLILASVMLWTWRNQAYCRSDPYADPTDYVQSFMRVNPDDPNSGRASPRDMVLRSVRQMRYTPLYWMEGACGMPLLSPLERTTRWNARAGWLLHLAILCAIVGAVGLGLIRQLVCPNGPAGTALALYLSAYLAVLVVWPYDEGGRFYIPVALPLLYFLLEGLLLVTGRARRPAFTTGTSACFAIIALAAWTVHVSTVERRARPFVARTASLAQARVIWQQLGMPPLCAGRDAAAHVAFGVPVRPCHEGTPGRMGDLHVYITNSKSTPVPPRPGSHWQLIWEGSPVWLLQH